jgi:hypothetical protein
MSPTTMMARAMKISSFIMNFEHWGRSSQSFRILLSA